MKGNQNYKQKLDAILELLKGEDGNQLYEAALDIYQKNFISEEDLKYILSSNENTLSLEQNDIHYHILLYKKTPHVLIGLQGSLTLIPCTGYTEDVYELNLDEMRTLNHEDFRMIVADTEKYRDDVHKVIGEYELDMVITEHGGSYAGDFDDI